MSGIDAVIFDLGNVLVRVDEARASRRMAERTGKTEAEVADYFRRTPHTTELALGQQTRKQFFRTIAKDLGFGGAYEEFAAIWSEIFTPIEPMVALAESLKTRLPRLILSNTNAIHMEYIFEHFAWIRDFDAHVLSHEVGLLKPDAAIYEHALRTCGLQAARAVFIDDISANVEGARRVGLQAFQYESVEQVRAELTKLGIAPI
jgi:putative hydrolase of the HAD superfamily